MDTPLTTRANDPSAPRLDDSWLLALSPPVLSPRVFRALAPIVSRRSLGLEYERAAALRATYRAHEQELSRFSELADVGLAMLDPGRSVDERREACVWLTLFPSEEAVDALARVLLDDTEVAALRNRAAWTLGFRQAQERHDAIHWPATAVEHANDALVEAWVRGLGATLSELPLASRHVEDPRLFAWLRDHLDTGWSALEAFADTKLARAMLEHLGEAPEEHMSRVARLAAHVLGAEACRPLLEFARQAPVGPRMEALFAATIVDEATAIRALDDSIAEMPLPFMLQARRNACLRAGGAVPHVRALRVARTTATLDLAARRDACVAAAADFAQLGRLDALHESYLHTMWRHVAFGARHDPETVIACVEGSRQALSELPALAEAYVVALCAVGRLHQAGRVAAEHGLHGRAAWETARRGRPFEALRIAAAARQPTSWSTAGEALAAFLVGRVDLAQAALARSDSDEQRRWDASDMADATARAVLDRDITALASQCTAAPVDADPDVIDFAWVSEAERRLRPRLDGKSVILVGFKDPAAKQEARVRVEEHGARVVDGAFGNVDLVVVADDCADPRVDSRLVVRSVPVVTLARALRSSADASVSKEFSPMPQLPRPYRVILLAPVLELAPQDRTCNGRIADLLGALVGGILARHPAVALPEPDMQHFHDGLGKTVAERQLFNREFGDFFNNILGQEFGDNQRDEALWLELALDPQRPIAAKLVTLRRGEQQPETFSAIGGPALSRTLEQCFDQWQKARGLPPSPDPFPTFSVQDFMNAARTLVQADQANDSGGDMGAIFERFQGPLFPAFVRAGWKMMIMNDLHRRLVGRVLQQAPNDPAARRIDWLYRSNEGKAEVAELKQISLTAPNWASPYMSMRGKGVGDDEALRNQFMAVVLAPSNDGAWMNLAYAFENTTRYAAAWRIADRMIDRDPADAGLYLSAVSFLRQTEREGNTFREALRRHHMMLRQSQEGSLNVQGFTQVQAGEFWVATAHFDVGRIDEAIAIGEKAIGEDDGQRLQWQQKQLREWKTEPDALARSYAREGHFRGDPARVVEGYGHGEPDCAGDAARLIDAHVTLGDEALAPCAYAHMHAQKRTVWHPVGRLAAARAILAGGAPLADALEHVAIARLRDPDAPIEAEVERLLRLAGSRPAQEWDAYVGMRLATGALRIAKMAARDAADFVPSANQSQSVARALAGKPARAFDPATLGSLKASFEGAPPNALSAVEGYFATRTEATLAAADRLCIDWVNGLAPEDEQHAPTRMNQLIFAFGHALCRYLTATTQPPNVLAGGYRRLATHALGAIAGASGPVTRNQIRRLLEAIEANAKGVDPWDVEPWLLRLERAFRIEANEGDLRYLTDGLPIVGDLLRGPQQIGLEYVQAHRLKDANTAPQDACALFERSSRALGKSEPFQGWSQVAVLGLPPEQALDAHWVCALANPTAAPPWINVAKGLFALGQPDAAFEPLVRGFPATGKEWRQARLAELRPLWEQARVQVPFDFASASGAAMQLMQQGQWEAAIRPLRWCDAIDPNNPTTKRNLGIAYARAGRPVDSVLALSQADATNGPAQASQALREANQIEHALRVGRYASAAFNTPEQWLSLGAASWHAEDDRTTADAFAMAHQLAGGRIASNQLNAWAMALLGLGEYDKARSLYEEIMKRNDDAVIVPYVLQGMAKALLGLGRVQEAMGHAQAAMQRAPQQSQQEFAQTLAQVQQGVPSPLKQMPPSERAFAALRAGDVKAAMEAARALPNDLRALRAALAASRYRFPTDNDTEVPRAAAEAALEAVQAVAGTTDPDGSLALYDAMKTCAAALFGIDVPPPLGASMSREAFRSRMGIPGQPAGMAQAQAAQQAVAAGAAGDMDPVVFPGQRVARLSDYVRIMKGMQSGNPMAALAKAGLDMQAYGQVAMQWGQAMQRDPTLVAKFQQMMTQP